MNNDSQNPLYPPLYIDPKRFLEAYNLDISEYVEAKNGLSYLSYSHAVRLLRLNFPELDVACVTNPLTGGYAFQEPDDRGFFFKAYLHDGVRRSAPIYYGVLNTSNAPVFPGSTDKNGNPTAHSSLFNKAHYRAWTKAIAIVTGIGLKLWTGDDLSEETLDDKTTRIRQVEALARRLEAVSGQRIELISLDYTTPMGEITNLGKSLQKQLKAIESKTPEPSENPTN